MAKKSTKRINDEGKNVPETCDCGGKVILTISGEPVYVCKKCGKYFGTMPCNIHKSKKIHITEEQFKKICSMFLKEDNENFFVEPQKVLIIKKYLDNNFVRGDIPMMGADGYPTKLLIVGMKGTDGQVMKNMTAKQLFYLLQDKFSSMYSNKSQRDKLLKQIIKDWYYKKISNQGLLTINQY